MIFAESKTYFTVWRGEHHENYSTFNLSTSRKDKRDGTYKNSNWNFVRFVGTAFDKAKQLNERDKITNVKFSLSAEPYVNQNGEKTYPKYPNMIIFDFEFANDGERPHSKPYTDEYSGSEDDGELPS